MNINGQPLDWHHADEVTDPTGAMVTTFDPGSLPEVPLPTVGVPTLGIINDYGDCYIDGQRGSCSIAMNMLNRGWGEEVPWDDTTSVWNPNTGQYELARWTIDWDNGFAGFVPVGANYGGDGTWSWKGPSPESDDEADGSIDSIRENIARLAERYVGSQLWLESVEKSGAGVGVNKCNIFINDVVEEAGAGRPLVPYKNDGGLLGAIKSLALRPPTAAEWGDKNIHIPGWEIVTDGSWRRGDVFAVNRPDGSGHVGIYTGNKSLKNDKGVISANAHVTPKGLITNTAWGMRRNQQDTVDKIVRRYVGKPDELRIWDDEFCDW